MTREPQTKLLHGELTAKVIEAFYQVHYELGAGFLESVYSKALELVLREKGLSVAREVPVDVYFRGQRVGHYRADQIVESVVVLELKAGQLLDPNARGQALNCLRASRLEVGLVLHFGPKPRFERLLYTNDRKLLP